MPVTVGQILELLESIAPIELAEEWDNVGLLVGRRDAAVSKVLCALDMSQGVLDEAIREGVQMIVTHHPLLFRPRRNLREEDPEGKLLCNIVRSGIAVAAMHTNFDNAHPGVNDALAERLGLKDVKPLQGGMCIGVHDECDLSALARCVQEKLDAPVRVYGSRDKRVKLVAVLGGSGEDYIPEAIACGADVYITGEVSYHKALDAVDQGLCVLEAGHAATEYPAISLLIYRLREAVNGVQYNVNVYGSSAELFL